MKTVDKDANNEVLVRKFPRKPLWLSFMVYAFSWQRFLN